MPRVPARSCVRMAVAAMSTVVFVGVTLTVSAAPAVAMQCLGGTENDFDGDGLRDVAIGDPDATVNGVEQAGRLHVMYGDGGSQTVSQADTFVNGEPEAGDRFGFALDSTDWNRDGCSDLVVSAPFEALATDAEAGWVQVLFGSVSGLGNGEVVNFYPNSTGFAGTNRAGDRFGYALAAGSTSSGEPYLLFGIPGREVTTSEGLRNRAGAIAYTRGTKRALTHQDSPGAFGIAEADDQFGYAVAASGRHVAAGGYGETVGTERASGTVSVFEHRIADDALTGIGGTDQAGAGQSGTPEADDWYGRTIALSDYRDSAGSPASLLVIGVPGEDYMTTTPDVGRLVTVSATGTLTELADLDQDDPSVDDVSEAGDFFGWAVTAVNRDPGAIPAWDDLLFAVGSPGESDGDLLSTGAVQVFSGVGAPGEHDVTVSDGHLAGTGFSRQSGQALGSFIHATATHLFIADPWGAEPAVYGIPWDNLLTGAAGQVLVFKPGSTGLPTDGVGSFGAALS